MTVTMAAKNEYAEARGYSDWYEFLAEMQGQPRVIEAALKDIELG